MMHKYIKIWCYPVGQFSFGPGKTTIESGVLGVIEDEFPEVTHGFVLQNVLRYEVVEA